MKKSIEVNRPKVIGIEAKYIEVNDRPIHFDRRFHFDFFNFFISLAHRPIHFDIKACGSKYFPDKMLNNFRAVSLDSKVSEF